MKLFSLLTFGILGSAMGQFGEHVPDWEIVEHTVDNKTFSAIRFDTLPEYVYRIQRSPDLSNWEDYLVFDGIDDYFTFPFAEIADDTDLDGSSSVADDGHQDNGSLQVSVVTLKSVGSGGTLVSWRSVFDEIGVQAYLADLDLNTEWAAAPLVIFRDNGFLLFILKDSTVVGNVPGNIPVLSSADQNLLNTIVTNFSSIATSEQTTPAAPPSQSDAEINFYRIKSEISDLDADGLPDFYEELSVQYGGTGTDPLNPDTDGDLVFDGAEVAFGSSPIDATEKPDDECIPES